jgi:hypothetical protein
LIDGLAKVAGITGGFAGTTERAAADTATRPAGSLPTTMPPSNEMARSRIPADVADAFGEALVLLVQWEGGADEPAAILDGRTLKISAIFELVAARGFRDHVSPFYAYDHADRVRLYAWRRMTLDETDLCPQY